MIFKADRRLLSAERRPVFRTCETVAEKDLRRIEVLVPIVVFGSSSDIAPTTSRLRFISF